MKRKTLLAIFLLGTFLLAMAVSVVALASPDEYIIYSNSLAGGGSGGGYSTSENYQMTMSFGGAVQVSAESANHETCSGFLCTLGQLLHKIFAPIIFR